MGHVTTLVLIRHARSLANAEGILAGRSETVLDDAGRQQSADLAVRLRDTPVDAAWTSPQLRTRQTAEIVLTGRVQAVPDDAFAECDYGDWSGRALQDLAQEPLWSQVQRYPSGASFPGGESMAAMAQRATRRIAELVDGHPEGCIWVFSHGDVIKAVLADALGMHLDLFQRIVVDPASASVVRYTPQRPFVERLNDRPEFLLQRNPGGPGGDAVVGGRAGQ